MCKAEIASLEEGVWYHVSEGRSSANTDFICTDRLLQELILLLIIVIYLIFWSGSLVLTPSPLCTCCVLETRTYRSVTLARLEVIESAGYIFFFVYENQAETLKCSIHNRFPEYLRLKLDMLIIINFYYSSVCLAVSRGNVLSLQLVDVLMKHVLLIYYLYLTYLYKAVWVSDEYMLQQRMVLSNRSDVHIFSAPWV